MNFIDGTKFTSKGEQYIVKEKWSDGKVVFASAKTGKKYKTTNTKLKELWDNGRIT